MDDRRKEQENAEIDWKMAETRKAFFEANKFAAEFGKLTAETAKINKEIRWHEIVVISGMTTAFILAATAILKLLFI